MSDWHEVEEHEPEEARSGRPGVGWGLLLIGIGVLALWREFGGLRLHNWWALFILIPGVLSLGGALEALWRDRALTQTVRAGIIGACYPIAVALIFMLELSWGDWWPVFVVLAGLQMVSAALPLTRADRSQSRAIQVTRPWLGFAGLGVMALGLGFLGPGLGWYDPAAWRADWWTATLLAPALGALISAGLFAVRDGRISGAVLVSLAAAAIMAVPGLAAFSHWGWELVAPLGMIAGGLVLLVGYLLHARESDGATLEDDR